MSLSHNISNLNKQQIKLVYYKQKYTSVKYVSSCLLYNYTDAFQCEISK